MDKKIKSGFSIKRVLLITAIALGALMLFIGLRYAYIMFINPMSAFEAPPTPTASSPTPAPIVTPPQPVITPSPTATPQPTETITPVGDTAFMQDKVNILFLGWDQSPEREDETSDVFRDETNNFRSDVIMLMCADFKNKTVHLISIPRDSYAPIYNDRGELYSTKGHWKINAAFAKGGSAEGKRGFEFAINTVSRLLGVPIDHYAGVDMDGLKAVVNAMGGITYDVDVRIVLNGRVLEKGKQHLDGQQVLDYCRARKGISTDVGRNDRQQRMLFAIFNKLKSTQQLLKMPKIYKSVRGYVHTDLTTDQIAALAALGMELNSSNLKRHTLAGEYNSSTPYTHANYYLIDNEALRALIKDIFGIVIPLNPRYDVNYVKADIMAKDIQVYINAADYLAAKAYAAAQSTAANASQDVALSACNELARMALRKQRLYTLSHRGDGADINIPFALQDMQRERDALLLDMAALCNTLGLTQKDIPKSRVPSELYSLLNPQT
ncbi:MAG: LCP family protein [Clostridia bacterium]